MQLSCKLKWTIHVHTQLISKAYVYALSDSNNFWPILWINPIFILLRHNYSYYIARYRNYNVLYDINTQNSSTIFKESPTHQYKIYIHVYTLQTSSDNRMQLRTRADTIMKLDMLWFTNGSIFSRNLRWSLNLGSYWHIGLAFRAKYKQFLWEECIYIYILHMLLYNEDWLYTACNVLHTVRLGKTNTIIHTYIHMCTIYRLHVYIQTICVWMHKDAAWTYIIYACTWWTRIN